MMHASMLLFNVILVLVFKGDVVKRSDCIRVFVKRSDCIPVYGSTIKGDVVKRSDYILLDYQG